MNTKQLFTTTLHVIREKDNIMFQHIKDDSVKT